MIHGEVSHALWISSRRSLANSAPLQLCRQDVSAMPSRRVSPTAATPQRRGPFQRPARATKLHRQRGLAEETAYGAHGRYRTGTPISICRFAEVDRSRDGPAFCRVERGSNRGTLSDGPGSRLWWICILPGGLMASVAMYSQPGLHSYLVAHSRQNTFIKTLAWLLCTDPSRLPWWSRTYY